MVTTWIVSEENWTLPVAVEFPEQNDVAAVRFLAGFPMLNIQCDALAAKLNAAGKYRDGSWWVLRSVLETIATKTVEDPERLVIWRPVEARVKYRSGPHNAARDEFFAEMAHTSMISDPVKCEVIWVSMCKVCISWMLNHQKPVPMGFCDLYAVPYRPNWKQLTLQRQMGKRTCAHGRRTSESKAMFTRREMAKSSVAQLIERGTGDDLQDPRLLFWCKKDGHMYWSIEARPRNMWWRMVKALETAKRKKRRGGLYLQSIGDTMKRLLPQTLDLYASYLQQVTIPFVKLAASVRKRSDYFVRKATKTAVLGEAALSYREPATHGDKEGESTVLDHVSSAAFVSTLSDFQRYRLEVRDTREDLAKSQNGQG